MQHNKIVRVAAVASLVFASLAVTSAAQANQTSETSDKGGTGSIQTVNKECEATIKVLAIRRPEKISVDVCKVQVTTSYSDARVITLADVWSAKESLSESDFDSLSRAVTAGTLSERVLSQQWLMTPFLNGFPVSWSETYTVRVNATGQVW
jgi:hypothetical protein